MYFLVNMKKGVYFVYCGTTGTFCELLFLAEMQFQTLLFYLILLFVVL